VEHIGIDLGAAHSHLVIMNERGTELERRRIQTNKLPRWLAAREPSRVVMEACTQSPVMAAASMEAGHETFVVPGQIVRALGVGARGIKTDDRDAEVLARALVRNELLPSVHLRSQRSRELRALLAARERLIGARTPLAQHIKSWLRARLIQLRGRANGPAFTKAVRTRLLESPDGLPLGLEVLLDSYDQLSEQLARLDSQIEELAEQDDTCRRLRTLPGVGIQTSLAFIAQVDDPHRFGTSDELGSYLALTPGECTTGGKVKRTGTIKAGPRHLKALLVQCAWSAWRSRPNDPMVLWARQIAERRGKRIAIVALARKIATILWRLWKDGSHYDPALASGIRVEQVTNAA